ncbi:Hypothetical predicted protein [Podarcis lilfordi]|uniref:Uncharacterized protein n=1 Tax=Podarcis lilfordi TaxID=74358 RepID=A0AA35JNH5_9SAUR|nr:Hypothetical predicted protein [Podarcis lilfordi]
MGGGRESALKGLIPAHRVCSCAWLRPAGLLVSKPTLRSAGRVEDDPPPVCPICFRAGLEEERQERASGTRRHLESRQGASTPGQAAERFPRGAGAAGAAATSALRPARLPAASGCEPDPPRLSRFPLPPAQACLPAACLACLLHGSCSAPASGGNDPQLRHPALSL